MSAERREKGEELTNERRKEKQRKKGKKGAGKKRGNAGKRNERKTLIHYPVEFRRYEISSQNSPSHGLKKR